MCWWQLLLLVGVLARCTQAFAPAPIRWGGLPSRRFALAPKVPPSGLSSNGVMMPQRLAIREQTDQTTPNDIPHFTANFDKTISWDGERFCIEASGDQIGDAILLNRCNGEAAQVWDFLPRGRGHSNQIRLKGTNRCIAVDNEGALNGASIALRDCQHEATESWIFEELPAPHHDASSLWQLTMFLMSSALLGSLSVSAWRWHKRVGTSVVHRGDAPLRLDQSGVWLTAPLVLSTVPATMAVSPTSVEEDVAQKNDVVTKKESPSPITDIKDVDIMNFELPTNDGNPELFKMRHSSAHVMAMALQRLRPEIQCTIGPCTETGFYYDFYVPGDAISDKDLKGIKKEMDKIIKKDLPFTREEVSREEARTRITAQNEPYKLEILDSIQTEPITIYHIGDEWWDLCAGPHVESTKQIIPNAVALQSLAGAYWRGSEENAMLTRIYGTAWENKLQLQVHKKRMEEAKKRDHRTLGKKLDLFSIQESAGGGLVFWHPKGSQIRRQMEDFWKDSHVSSGYELLTTPHVADLGLWKTSGHHSFYSDDMFRPMEVEGKEVQLKPMNCPFHCLVFKDSPKSYRDLPKRWAELGTVYRYENSGSLSGLFRVRGFTQDDAHIFCLPSQLEDEILGVLDLTEKILTKFGFIDYEVMLSTRPEKSVGTDEIWEKATDALRGALERKGWSYTINEGDGAFYGPKIDFKIKDAIGRSWQCSTVQCDFNLPERFELEYTDNEGAKQRPIMVHRAIFGSLERFFGIMIENSAGDFPLWIAPTQLKLLPVTQAAIDYCYNVKAAAEKHGLRVDVGEWGQLGKAIKVATQQQMPLVGVVGEKEIEANTLSIRSRKAGELGTFSVDAILESMKKAVDEGIELHEVEDVISHIESSPEKE